MDVYKRCPHCNADLPLEAFHCDVSTTDGLTVYCRTCRSEMHRTWFQEHHAERTVKIAHWKAEHADEVRAADAARKRLAYATNPKFKETIKQRNRDQYLRRKGSAGR